MTATTQDRNSPALGQPGRLYKLPLQTAADIPAGVLVGVTNTGATNAANTAGMRIAGRSVARATQATGGDANVIAQGGVYAFAAAAALAAAAPATVLWKEVYVVDNQTVGLATEAGGITSNRVLAGVLVQITDGRFYVAVAEGMELGTLTGQFVGPVANAAVSPAVTVAGVPVVIAIDIPDAATATYTYVTQEALEFIEVEVIKDVAGAGNTIQLKNGAGTAISDAIAAAVDKTKTLAGTLDKATRTIAAGGSFQITATRAAGSMAAQVFLHAIKR